MATKKTEQSKTTSSDSTTEQEEPSTDETTPTEEETALSAADEAQRTADLLEAAEVRRKESRESSRLQDRIEEWQSRTKSLSRFNGTTLR
jgi:hypothetical protein